MQVIRHAPSIIPENGAKKERPFNSRQDAGGDGTVGSIREGIDGPSITNYTR